MTETKGTTNTITMCDGTPFVGKIEIGFTGVVPPLPMQIQTSYEKEITENGIQISLDVWAKGTDPVKYILVKGHFEYLMALKHGLPFTITLRHFDSDDDVIRFIVKATVYSNYLTKYQRCELILKYKGILTVAGKENMRNGGKGLKISKKVDTMVELADMINSSHDTLRKVQLIKNELEPDDERLIQLRNGEISINSVYEGITGKKKNIKIEPETKNQDEAPIDIFSLLGVKSDNVNSSEIPSERPKLVIKSKFHINETNKYQGVFINPRWNLSDAITIPDNYLVELRRMNISEIVYNKYCTLLIQTPSKYLGDTLNIIQGWGFKCVESLCISNPTTLYSAKYAEQNHQILLICELNVGGVPQTCVTKRPSNSIINADDVMDTINEMFDENVSKLSIFTEPILGWDSYDFDYDSKMMINFHDKAA
jgi:hypothetical protein